MDRDGRPAPADESAPQAEAELPTTGSYVLFPPDFSQAEIDAFLADYPGGQIDQISLPPPDTDRPRVSPELEGLIPTDLIPSSDVSSARASEWRSSLLNRALTRLDIRPKDAVVVTGIGGTGEQTLTVSIYGVPGVTADLLESEFRTVIYMLPGSRWAYWTKDGLVIHVTGQPDVVEGAIPRLP